MQPSVTYCNNPIRLLSIKHHLAILIKTTVVMLHNATHEKK